jgi:hypothetical protein
MERREVLRLLSSTLVLSALPSEALSLFHQAHADAAQSPRLKTLDPHRNATVITIAELIIPETDTPGAKGAKVNEFIDLLLTEWFEPAETTAFLGGLDQVDAKSRSLYSVAFVDAKPEQQLELLKQLDDAAMEFARKQKATRHRPGAIAQTTALPDVQKPEQQEAKQPPVDFFYQFKRLTLMGYYTSEIGFEKELGKTIIPSGHNGCAPLEVRK